jgi:regulator of sigma E protease
VVALSVIVAVHEFGHYIVGRWTGIDAEVFSLGFGPVLFSREDRRGTRWQVAALPLGGYVKFLGDADAASAGHDPEVLEALTEDTRRRTMHGAPLWARALTVAAGPAFNFALSILVFALVISIRGIAAEPVTVGEIRPMPGAVALEPGDVILEVDGRPAGTFEALDAAAREIPVAPEVPYLVLRDGAEREVTAPHPFPPVVVSVAPDSAAGDVDMRRGDVIVAVEDEPVAAFEELREAVGESGGEPVLLRVWRDGGETDMVVVPRRVDLPVDGGFETRWLVGLTGGLLFEPETRTPGPLAAMAYGVEQTGFIIQSSLSGIYHMAAGAISSCNLSGPIGIAQTSGQAASQGGLSFVWFIAILSTAVGLLNLFPIPILDGGHLVFHAYEAVRGRPPSEQALRVLMTIGLAFLLTLMVFAVTNDLFCP